MNNHKRTYLHLTWLAGVLILLSTTTAQAVTPACGTTLTTNTTLDSDMNCPSTALFLSGAGSNSVILDCVDFSITTTGRGSTAISASDVTGIEIKNCNIETNDTLSHGVRLGNTSASVVSNNTITTLNTFSHGISLITSSGNTIDSNSASTTGISSRGIYLADQSSSNIVSGNNILATKTVGIRLLAGSNSNALSQNSVESGASHAVDIQSSSDNQLTSNTFISPISFVGIRNLSVQNGGLSVDDAGNIFAVENNFGSSGGSGGAVETMIQVDPNTGDALSAVRLVSGGVDLGFGFDSLEIIPGIMPGDPDRFLATRGGNSNSLYEINPISGEVSPIPLTLPTLLGSLNGLQSTGGNTLLATTNRGELLSIDLDTNTASLIGQDGGGWTDLAMHPTLGSLYTLTRWSLEPSGTNHLYEIDPVTGNIIQEIGDTGNAFLSDIDFSASGVLYSSDGLVTIDINNNGVATYIGGFGPDPFEPLSQNNTLTNQTFTATTTASVQFLAPVDLPPSLLLSLDADAIQLGQNNIFVDSALFPFLDVPARITFENLGGTIRNLLADLDDDGTFEACGPPLCTLISFTGGTLIFDVTGFTTYSSISGSGNTPPTAFALVSPADGAMGLGTSLTFVWKKATDPDGDSLSYQFFLCEDSGFSGCTPIVVASAEKLIDFAGAEGLLPLVLFGTVLGGIGLRRRKWLIMVIASLAIVGLVSNCGGGGGGGTALTDEKSHTVSGLKSGATYHWKVSVSDGTDTVESATRSFATQ